MAGRKNKSLERLNGTARTEFTKLEQLPNVGSALAKDLQQIGVTRPGQLVGKDAFQLYHNLCRITGERHDPCVIDVFLAVIRFMEGGEAQPWWAFTAERKQRLANEVQGEA